MASPQVMHFSDFSSSDIKFGNIRKNQNQGKTIYLNNLSGGKILLQLPKSRNSFGLSAFEEPGKRPSYHLSLSLTNESLVSALNEIDERVLDFVAENSEECLGKVINKTVMREALFTPLVKPPSDPKYPPSLKLKVLANDDGSFVPEVYDSKEDEFNLRELQKGQDVVAIVNVASIWVVGTKFGVTVRLEQLLVFPQNKLKGFAFLKRDDLETAQNEDEDIDI